MIPVRVNPVEKPLRVSEPGRFSPLHDHPLVGVECPACGEPLRDGDTIALVLVGRAPDAGWTAGSVAVHDACAS